MHWVTVTDSYGKESQLNYYAVENFNVSILSLVYEHLVGQVFV